MRGLSENRRMVRAGEDRVDGWRRSGTPQRSFSSRASRICLRYPGRDLLESSMSARFTGREAGWYRGKELSSRERILLPGFFAPWEEQTINQDKGECKL